MRIISEPPKKEWKQLLERPVLDATSLEATVSNILQEVKEGGDEALKRFSLIFDKSIIEDLKVSTTETDDAENTISEELKAAIQVAKNNIELFHSKQKVQESVVETMIGVRCWRKAVAIEKVGLYIPGGSAPLFSTLLMLGIPAKIAGCKQIVLCTPPDKSGKIHPAILYTAKLLGIDTIIKVGGAQAIAAMGYGTETVPQVYKIFGPGNQYVTCAKQLLQKEGIAIDMPAGPSEVCVLADETSVPAFIAADLLSQAEHGPDSQVLLITTSEAVAKQTIKEVQVQLESLPRKEIAEKALANSKVIITSNIEAALELVNEYAAEHLIIAMNDAEAVAEKIINAGSVFIGHYSPESVGDYASGTNHTLPTNGFARAYSGVSLDSFVKKITFQQLSREGLESIADSVETMAEAEGLTAHANAVRIRRKK
jgi:histidinol dehydrogenase